MHELKQFLLQAVVSFIGFGGLFIWALVVTKGKGLLLTGTFDEALLPRGSKSWAMIQGINTCVGLYSTVSSESPSPVRAHLVPPLAPRLTWPPSCAVNIPDFSRFARQPKSNWGQILTLPCVLSPPPSTSKSSSSSSSLSTVADSLSFSRLQHHRRHPDRHLDLLRTSCEAELRRRRLRSGVAVRALRQSGGPLLFGLLFLHCDARGEPECEPAQVRSLVVAEELRRPLRNPLLTLEPFLQLLRRHHRRRASLAHGLPLLNPGEYPVLGDKPLAYREQRAVSSYPPSVAVEPEARALTLPRSLGPQLLLQLPLGLPSLPRTRRNHHGCVNCSQAGSNAQTDLPDPPAATDFFLIKKQKVDIREFYNPRGIYMYFYGFNLRALGAWLFAFAPNLPSFAHAVDPSNPDVFPWLYKFSWFFSTASAVFWFWLLNFLFPAHATRIEEAVYEVHQVRLLSFLSLASLFTDSTLTLALSQLEDNEESAIGSSDAEKEIDVDKEYSTGVVSV